MKSYSSDQKAEQPVWGILGGMGPLASSEFVNTIYEKCAFRPEQERPIVILLSDPTMPDRSKSFLAGGDQELLDRLLERVNQLVSFGITKIIICCVTIHPLIERLPPALQSKIISLLDVIFERVLLSDRKHLLLCTEGTRYKQVFQNHGSWKQARGRIVLPDRDDQRRIHELIYQIKTCKDAAGRTEFIDALLAKYAVDSYISGCTEIHILAKAQQRAANPGRTPLCIDPLAEIASMICNLKGAPLESSELMAGIAVQNEG